MGCSFTDRNPTNIKRQAQRSSKKGGLLVGVDLSKQQRKADSTAAAAAAPPGLLAGGVNDPYRVVGLPQQQGVEGGQGRLIVIDAANVAMRHGRWIQGESDRPIHIHI